MARPCKPLTSDVYFILIELTEDGRIPTNNAAVLTTSPDFV
jgi:hypothetical protein